MKSRIVVSGIAGLVILGVGSIYSRTRAAAPPHAATAPTVTWSPEQTREPDLPPQVAVAPSLGADIPPTAPVPASSAEAAPAPAPRARQDAPHTSAELRDHLEASFVSEGTDRAWSVDARAKVESRLAALLPRSSVRAIDCRSSMCRIETVHKNFEEYRSFALSAFRQPETRLASGEAFITPATSASGEVTAVAYTAREGGSLPPMD